MFTHVIFNTEQDAYLQSPPDCFTTDISEALRFDSLKDLGNLMDTWDFHLGKVWTIKSIDI